MILFFAKQDDFGNFHDTNKVKTNKSKSGKSAIPARKAFLGFEPACRKQVLPFDFNLSANQ